VLLPLFLFTPLGLAVREVWEALGLPAAWHLPYLVGAILWVAAAVWRLTDWHEARCHPQSQRR
jgi:hypothetical protein